MGFLQSTIKRNWRTLWSFLAPLIDFLIGLGSYAVTSLWESSNTSVQETLSRYWRFAAFSLLFFLTLNLARGLYRKFAFISFRRQLYHSGISSAYTVAVVFSVYYLTKNTYYPHGFLIVYFLVFSGLYGSVWLGLRRLLIALGKLGYGRWRTLLVGSEDDLGPMSRRIERHPELGYDVKDVVHTPPHPAARDLLLFDPRKVEDVIDERNIELVVFSSAQMDGSFEAMLKSCKQRGTMMRLVSVESDFLFSRARLRDFAGIALYSPPRTRIEGIKRRAKRAMDIFGAALLLVIASPVLLFVAVLTKIESPGPVFFKQKRALSDDHTPFDLYKFRTMHLTADSRKSDIDYLNESSGALFKVRNDPRLTRIGKLIRRSSIDELPQLINVIKGEMSLVGPRPLPVADFERISGVNHMGGYFRQRARVKPGITGLWQVSGRSDLGFREMVLLDLYYIEHQSVMFDLEIMMQTIPAVFLGKGSY